MGLDTDVDIGWTLLCGAMVFLMRAGFALVESGNCRQKSMQSVFLKNWLDAVVGAMAWFCFGYGFAFGESTWENDGGEAGGFMGTDKFATGENADDGTGANMVLWFFQWTFAATASTIVSGAVAERMTLHAYLSISFYLNAFVYPVVVHWAWSGNGWLTGKGYNDFAGSGVVHMFGGVCALTAAAILGPRTGRFDENSKVARPSSLVSVTLGCFILWFGWYGFNPGSTLGLSGGNALTAARAAVTTTISGAAGGCTAGLFAMLLHPERRISLVSVANGILGGLVGITAGCAGMTGGYALLTGFISGLVVEGATRLLEKLKIDDPVGASPVHGFCGAWGVLATGMFDMNGGWFAGNDDADFDTIMGPNIIGILSIAGWCVACLLPLLLILKVTGQLRISSNMESVGIDLMEFAENDEQSRAVGLRASKVPDAKAAATEGEGVVPVAADADN